MFGAKCLRRLSFVCHRLTFPIAKWPFWLLVASLVLTGCIAEVSAAGPEANEADGDLRLATADVATTPRVEALVDRARKQDWNPDRLFRHLGLDETDGCRNFTDRADLRERHARWSEAVVLLDRIDPDALEAWLLGIEAPPETAAAEAERQLECLLKGLIDAALYDDYEIRFFHNLDQQFGGRFASARELAIAADNHSVWRDRTINALTRSTFRNIHSQAGIWSRKFRFAGRAFNRISNEAAGRCSLEAGHLWRPSSDIHRRCWHGELSPKQREREILQASAPPGASRHHWGTDIDILSLNPIHYTEHGILHDDWRWLDDHALDYGFFQTFRDDRDADTGYAHMEEPWHWSYYPIGQALWDFIYDNQKRYQEALFAEWDRLERRWSPRFGPYFDHLRDHWRDYLFHIHLPSVAAERSPDNRRRGPSLLP